MGNKRADERRFVSCEMCFIRQTAVLSFQTIKQLKKEWKNYKIQKNKIYRILQKKETGKRY
jgi:hypothetical protein